MRFRDRLWSNFLYYIISWIAFEEILMLTFYLHEWYQGLLYHFHGACLLKGFFCYAELWFNKFWLQPSRQSLACSSARKVVLLVGSMALLSEFLNVTILVFTRPFSYFMHACSVILKISIIVVLTWWELLKTSINVHLNIFWTILMWVIAFVSLPGRILAALQRERQVSPPARPAYFFFIAYCSCSMMMSWLEFLRLSFLGLGF